MAGDVGFGLVLERLADRRRLNIGALRQLAGVAELNCRHSLPRGAPRPSASARLAPVLGLHQADLFAIAGVGVLTDVAPLDPKGQRCSLSGRTRRRAAAGATGHLTSGRGVPAAEAAHPACSRAAGARAVPGGPGRLLMRMVRNRNLGSTATAKTFLSITGRYWSAATYGAVGHGRKQLTPEILETSALCSTSPPTIWRRSTASRYRADARYRGCPPRAWPSSSGTYDVSRRGRFIRSVTLRSPCGSSRRDRATLGIARPDLGQGQYGIQMDGPRCINTLMTALDLMAAQIGCRFVVNGAASGHAP